MLIALSALIGHFLNLSALYRVARYNRMLVPTAFALFALSVGFWFKLQSPLDGDDLSADAFARRITRRSAGILTLVGQQDAFASAIMQRADQALYVAKKAGRDRFHVSVSDEFNEIG